MDLVDLAGDVSERESDATALRRKRLSAARAALSWMQFIGGFTALNVVASLLGLGFRMVIGAALTEIFMALGHRLGPMATFAATVLALAVAGGYFACAWLFRKRGYMWAPIVVIVFYSLDFVLTIMLRDLVGTAFHAIALFYIVRGFQAFRVLVRERIAERATRDPSVEQTTEPTSHEAPSPRAQEAALESV